MGAPIPVRFDAAYLTSKQRSLRAGRIVLQPRRLPRMTDPHDRRCNAAFAHLCDVPMRRGHKRRRDQTVSGLAAALIRLCPYRGPFRGHDTKLVFVYGKLRVSGIRGFAGHRRGAGMPRDATARRTG